MIELKKEDAELFSKFVNDLAAKCVVYGEGVPTPKVIKFYFYAFYKPMWEEIKRRPEFVK